MSEVIFKNYTWILCFSSCGVYVLEITSPIYSTNNYAQPLVVDLSQRLCTLWL